MFGSIYIPYSKKEGGCLPAALLDLHRLDETVARHDLCLFQVRSWPAAHLMAADEDAASVQFAVGTG